MIISYDIRYIYNLYFRIGGDSSLGIFCFEINSTEKSLFSIKSFNRSTIEEAPTNSRRGGLVGNEGDNTVQDGSSKRTPLKSSDIQVFLYKSRIFYTRISTSSSPDIISINEDFITT